MELCPICFETGEVACTCGRQYHVGCINKLLENGFDSCQCCFAPFSAHFHIRAARQALIKDNYSPASQIQMAAALTLAKRPAKAVTILEKSPAESATPLLQAARFIELGKAYLALGQSLRATQELYACIVLAKIAGKPAIELEMRAMAFLCRAYYDRGDDKMTHAIAAMALGRVHLMSHREAIYIMRVIADTFKREQKAQHYKATLEVLCEILNAESRDQLAKAAMQAELGIAEHELGLESSARLKPAIKTLRKKGHPMTATASLALQTQVKPSKRIREKRHPENVA